MLSRWLRRRRRLQHADANIRLQAIAALDDQQALQKEQLLVQLALADADMEVRKAALLRVNKPNPLAALLDDEALAEYAAAHIARLVSSGVAAACQNHKQVLAARVHQASTAELAAVLSSIHEPQQLAELAVKLRDPKRQQVLQHPSLLCEQGLTVLEKTARGRNKFCNRYAREQLEQLKKAKGQCQSSLARVQELDAAIHKETKHHPQGAEALIAQRQKLSKLGDMRNNAVQSLQQATTVLGANGGDIAAFSVPANPLQDVDLFIPDPSSNPFAQLITAFQDMAQQMRSAAPIEQISRQRDELSSRWLSHADKFPPTSSQHAVFEQVSKQYQQYLGAWQRYKQQDWESAAPPGDTPTDSSDPELYTTWRNTWQQHLDILHWPAGHQPPPAVDRVSSLLAELNTHLAADAEQRRADAMKLNELIGAATDALADGHVADTTRHLQAARALYKATSRDKQVEQSLHMLSGRLSELRDWQHFATAPKRKALLSQLQNLCEAPLPPQAQVDHLRTLRQQWRQLGHPDSAEVASLQAQFDQLAEQAYAPCQAYFAQQNQLRAENLQQRSAICEQLRSYLQETDWATAEIKAAESILRTARQAWRNYHPCERKALKPVEAEFEVLQEQLHTHIKAAWDNNVAQKKALVKQAEALLKMALDEMALDEAALDEAIDGAKSLQYQWREIGPTPRRADQRLWHEFRRYCDQIFAQRDAAYQAAQAEQSQLQAALEAAITALQQAAENSSAEDASKRQQQALNSAIDAVAADVRPTPGQQRRIEAANNQYAQRLKEARQQQAQQQLQQWQSWDIEVSQAEAQGTSLTPPDPIFAPRLQGTATPEDWLQLTLNAEIAANIPSPSEDLPQRMALQIELMNAGIRRFSAKDRQQLLQRWCAAGPKDAAAEQLRERFFRAITS